VTSMAGGAADKAGNQYEQWWTAYRVADLLTGPASRMRLEPPGAAGQGIEFEVDEQGHTCAEQVKGASSGSNWTINRLNNERVLANALIQVKMGRLFRFVASMPAPQVATLSRRSRESTSLAEFQEALTKELEPEFQILVADWGVTPEEAWLYLQSIYVDHYPAEALRRLVASTYKHLFAGDPGLVLAELRSFCDDHMHEDLTAPRIWSHLTAKGFQRRHLAGDENTVAKLHKTVERQTRRTDKAAPDIGLVQSTNAARLLDVLKSTEGKQVVFVDGRAGYGKSTIVAELARTLEDEGWFVAVARMDVLDPSTTTSLKLGEEMGLGTESSGVLLGGVSDGSPALLIVDQLDAVSLYSGRIPDVFDAVDETLDELSSALNVKILLVVRTVDLEADPRLRRLSHQDRTDRVTIDRLTEEEVRAKLEAAGIPVPVSQITLDLLRTPLHLTIFLRLSGEAQKDVYPSLQDLYNRYTEELRTDIGRELGHLDWNGITTALVNDMNEHERLSSPISVLNSAAPEEWHALESAAVLIRDTDTIAFFHESYFDYLFARAFVGSGRRLLDFLTSTGQHLFRRAQTRQVLEHLLSTDRSQFRVTTSELLGSKDVRSHVKEVILDVLAQVEPSPEDWLAVDDVAWSDDPTAWRVLALLGHPNWFEVVDSLGKWPEWLSDPVRVDRAFHQLLMVARDRPERVTELLHPFAGTSDAWRLRLKALVEWSLKPGSVDFAIELLERGEIDDARGPIAVNSDFWSIVYSLAQDDRAAAAKLVGAYLDRGLARAREAASDDPFESGQLPDHSPSDEIIDQIAISEPEAFLDAVLPFVTTVAMANQHQMPERLPTGKRWAYRHHNSSYSVDDKIFEGVEQSLCELAKVAPDRCERYLEDLVHADSEELRFLACRALAIKGSADDAVEWLIDDPRNFMLGWMDSPRWASRELVERWSPRCSDDAFERLEQSIMAYQPSWESHPQGRGRYQMLSALDEERMSAEAQRELAELKRRFPDALRAPAVGGMAGFVGSPISDDAASYMTDVDWLQALRKHNTDRTDWKGDKPVGGARELAQVLGRRAALEPERFASLASQFDETVHSSALDSVIRGIAQKVDTEILADVCEHAATVHGSEVGRTICSVAQQVHPMTPRLAELVASYVDDPDPDREWARTGASSGQPFYGGDLDSAGLNCTRGQAAYAAASALFQSSDHLDLLGPVVERLAADPILAVRVYAAEGVSALMNHDQERAYGAAETLLDTHIDVFNSRNTELLLTYLVMRQPDRFGGALLRALDGPDEITRRAGRVWAQAAARDGLPDGVPSMVNQLSPAARRGAAEMFAVNVSDSAHHLPPLFDDDGPDVRKAAAWAMRQLEGVPAEQTNALITAFLDSKAFEEHFDGLVDALGTLNEVNANTALNVCERAVGLAGHEVGDVRTSRSMMGQPIMHVVLAIYRQGDADVRSRCLDVIDRLSERNAFGVREALEDER
jgi:hypothetical protein